MTHTVAIGEFEGPLGILLQLVERNKLEITAISLADITTQYLERMHQLQPASAEELSEFVQLGARLLYVKSLALLPQESEAAQTDELLQLNRELDEYRRFRAAAQALGRTGKSQTWHRTTTQRLDPDEMPMPDVSLSQLTRAFTAALRRAEPASPKTVIRRRISLESKLAHLASRLKTGPIQLAELLRECQDRPEIIVTFLAVLELVRTNQIHVMQTGQYAPITLEASRG